MSFFEVPSKAQNPTFLDQLPDVIPIGQGIVDVQLLVINRDDRTKQCAIGEQGELYLRVGSLAEGYLENDEKTAELNRSKFYPQLVCRSSEMDEQTQQPDYLEYS